MLWLYYIQTYGQVPMLTALTSKYKTSENHSFTSFTGTRSKENIVLLLNSIVPKLSSVPPCLKVFRDTLHLGFVQDFDKRIQGAFNCHSRTKTKILKTKSTMAIGTFITHRKMKIPKTRNYLAYQDFTCTIFKNFFGYFFLIILCIVYCCEKRQQ